MEADGWGSEIRAIFLKEARTELRTKSGLYSAGLFSVVAVVGIALASFGRTLDANVAAGLLSVTLMFSATVSLPRVFVAEEESGTSDLLRLLGRPHAVFWGKALFNLAEMTAMSAALSVLFLALTGTAVSDVPLYLVSIVGTCVAASGAVTLCGALVAQAAHRSTLVGAIGIPVLLPLVAMGVGALRVAFGMGGTSNGWMSAAGLFCYAVAVDSAGSYLFAVVWKG